MPARKKAEAQEDPAAEAAEAQPAAEEVAPDSAAAETAAPGPRTVAQILADFDPRYRPASQAYVVELYRGVATYVNGSMPDGEGKAPALEGLSRSLGDALSLVGGGQPKVAQ